MYDATKQGLLQRGDHFQKCVRLYERFLGVYNSGPDDLDLSLPRESESVQTDFFAPTKTTTNSETQRDGVRNTQKSTVTSQKIREERDASVSVIPSLECEVTESYSQKSHMSKADYRGHNNRDCHTTTFGPRYPPACVQRKGEVTSGTRGSL
ncbi:hypothetical protein QAD02_008247 [Eretmocerus hayati]|uniref:Uncharacterized protein n=1 Tax=Eretmocerus hayati TaxID=131215 RepID=A0ACC2NAA6_9HYME|nr:hypothetical protein QAD02_008247 [Eretmocerus hayati]